jgi:hypothetical protein
MEQLVLWAYPVQLAQLVQLGLMVPLALTERPAQQVQMVP